VIAERTNSERREKTHIRNGSGLSLPIASQGTNIIGDITTGINRKAHQSADKIPIKIFIIYSDEKPMSLQKRFAPLIAQLREE
jgi:hypothetical protein